MKIIKDKITRQELKNYYHKQLALGKWNKLSFFEQMANIGSEVERTINWRYKKQNYFQKTFD